MIISLIFALQTEVFANPARVRALRCRAQMEGQRSPKGKLPGIELTGDKALDGLVSIWLPRLPIEDQMLLLEVAYEIREVTRLNPRPIQTENLIGYATAELVQYMQRKGIHRDRSKLLLDIERRAIAIKDSLD